MIVYKVNLLHSLLTIHRGSFVTNVATKLQETNHVLQFKTKSIKNYVFSVLIFFDPTNSFTYKDKYSFVQNSNCSHEDLLMHFYFPPTSGPDRATQTDTRQSGFKLLKKHFRCTSLTARSTQSCSDVPVQDQLA